MAESPNSILTDTLFENVFRYAAIGMTIVSPQGRFLAVNPALCRILGYTQDELLQMRIQDITHPDDLEISLENIQQLFAGQIQSYSLEKRYLHKQGHVIWGSLTGSLPQEDLQQPAYIIGQVQDITTRKRAEQRFRALLDSAPDAMILSNEHGQIVLCNTQGERLFGYTQGELIGQPLEILVPARFRHLHPHHRNAYYEHPAPRVVGNEQEIFARRKDGTEIPVEISLNALDTEAGRLICSAIRDISERRQALARLHRHEELLRQTSEIANAGGWEADVATGRVLFSEQTYKIHDLPTHVEPVLEGSYQFFPTELQPLLRKRVQQAVQEAKGWDLELPFISAAGRHRWVRVTCEPVLEQGQVVRLHGIYQDITARKQQEDRLHDSLAFQDAVLDSANFAIIATDLQGQISLFNAGAERMLGYKASEVIGKPATLLLDQSDEMLRQDAAWPAEAATVDLNLFGTKITEQGPAQRDWIYRRKNGTPITVRVFITAIRDANQVTKGYLGMAQDLSEQRSSEHLFDKCLAMLNRLLATPMARLQEMLEASQPDRLDPADPGLQATLSRLRREGESLFALSTSLLAIEQGRQSRSSLDMRPLLLKPQLDEAIQHQASPAQARGVQLQLQEDIPEAMIVVDAARFQQIMAQLLLHAIQASPQATLEIGAELQASRVEVSIRSRSTDVGLSAPRTIDPLSLQDLLNLAPESQTRLDLQVSQSLIESMGGKLSHARTDSGIHLRIDLPRAAYLKIGRREGDSVAITEHG